MEVMCQKWRKEVVLKGQTLFAGVVIKLKSWLQVSKRVYTKNINDGPGWILHIHIHQKVQKGKEEGSGK